MLVQWQELTREPSCAARASGRGCNESPDLPIIPSTIRAELSISLRDRPMSSVMDRTRRIRCGLLITTFLLGPKAALAGMPVFMLTDLADLRLQTISFFLLVIALVSLAIQRLWNRLRRDFPSLPRLSYRGGLCFVLLWGLAFHLVLTMISGARELMTPGAWERDRATYKLQQTQSASEVDQLRVARHQKLERLRAALWQHAEQNNGRFPLDDYGPEVAEELWLVLDPARLHFVYLGGSVAGVSRTPLAFEPGIYGRERLVLLTDGEIKTMTVEAIYAAIPNGSS